MRKLLTAAVAIAPLLVAAGAHAEVVISTARTTPVVTSTATGTAADDVRIASGGVITLDEGVAITLDSDNDVDLDSGSKITMDDSDDDTTAILVEGGNTANVTIGGVVTISDDIAADADIDTDNDLDDDGPFANGSGRYGVRVMGADAFTGNILVETAGNIAVEGNESYGLRVETDLVGDLTTRGVVGVTGNDSYAVRTEGNVDGDVELSGTITARGEDSIAASIEGDVNGRLTIQGGLTTTGYRYTTRPNDTFIAHLDADDLLQGGSALVVSSNVSGGLLIDVPPVDADDEETDEDDDGQVDSAEGTGSVVTVGSAPAIVIGAEDRSIALGAVGADAAEAYGFINRGSVAANGIYDGASATGVLIGGGAGQTVTIEGGVRNSGAISTTAYKASTYGLRFGEGAIAPTLLNTGGVTVQSAGDTDSESVAIRIDAGANVGSITNNGPVTALAGYASDAIAIQDLSGTVAEITNTRIISVGLAASGDATKPTTGSAVAIDVSANTTGFTLNQYGVLYDDPDDDDENNPIDSDEDGVPDAFEPYIIGEIRLGSGADTLNFQNGSVTGDIAFGAGLDTLNITGGAAVSSAISDSDGQLDINVEDGVLYARQTAPTTISNLELGEDGTLLVLIDPEANEQAGFNVTGTANIETGAALGVRFASLIQDPERFTIINATTLTAGTIDQALVQGNSPYLLVTSAGVDQAAGDVYIDVRRRTAAEADLIPVEAQAFDAVYAALADNDDLRNLFLNQTERAGFIEAYEQMLPDHSGGPLLSLSAGVDAVTRALTGRNAAAAPGETSAWVQEINFYAEKDRTDTYGFESEGFGVAGGVERGTGLGAFGITAAFTSSDLEDPEAAAEELVSANLLELGLYWRAQGQYWTTWARAAGGYATFQSTRKFVGGGLNLTSEADWHGMTLAVAGGASYERSFGRLSIRPELYGEYFYLREDAHEEDGGGDGFDLVIDERDGHILAGVAAVNIGYGFGENGWLRPELRLGWRQNISVDAGETIARFASGGSDFILSPADIEGGGFIAGLRINVGNELGMLSLSADAELLEDYVRYSLLLRASFRF